MGSCSWATTHQREMAAPAARSFPWTSAPQCTRVSMQRQQTRQQHQQQYQQQQEGRYWVPAPPHAPEGMPDWALDPAVPLAWLPECGAPCLRKGQPLASQGVSMVVQLALGKVPVRRGSSRRQISKDILTLLTRDGLQRPNSTQKFADLHQTRQVEDTVDMLVGQGAAEMAAAREAVAEGYVSVGSFNVPISWAPSTLPAGCTPVTVHQLPVEWVRQGCGTALLRAAQQQGEVVCEFLGGSSWMGDAQLSCPAADAVVLWVRYPPEDPFLTQLPSGFQVQGRSGVQINVAGRPSLAPETWLQLTQRRLRLQQTVYDAVQRAATAASQPENAQPQRRRQQQQDTGPQQQQRRQQQQQQQQHDAARNDTAQRDVEMYPADPAQPMDVHNSSQHTTQQQPLLQQRQQQQDVDMDSGAGSGTAGAAAGASTAAGAAEGVQLQGPPAELLPSDPFGDQHSHDAWVRLQQEQMLRDATELVADEAEDSEARKLTAQDKRRLQAAFSRDFAAQLQQQDCPPELQVRTWLRQQLGISQLSYDDGEDDAARYRDSSSSSSSSRAQQDRRGNGNPPPAGASGRPLTAAVHSRETVCAGLSVATKDRWASTLQPCLVLLLSSSLTSP